MNIDDIIKTINESKQSMDSTVPTEGKHEFPDSLVKALAAHMGAQKPEDLMKLIIRLTTEVEKSRLMAVNQALRAHEEFNSAMAELHQWRAEQEAKKDS